MTLEEGQKKRKRKYSLFSSVFHLKTKKNDVNKYERNVEEIRFQFFDGIGFDPEVASRGRAGNNFG